MKNLWIGFFSCLIALGCNQTSTKNIKDYTTHVNPFIGTGANGCAIPVASVPHGMVQVAPDTRETGSGYHYNDSTIIGFSHLHKTGGGCADMLDILFQPISDSLSMFAGTEGKPHSGYRSRFSHEQESVEPGKYKVKLLDYNIDVELSATERAAIHRYSYPNSGYKGLIIDLKHGNTGACTIVPEDSYDTVRVSGIEVIDDYTIQGYRISDGWAKGQHVFFTARFSQPFKKVILFDNEKLTSKSSLNSTNVKALLKFDENNREPLMVKVGISPVDKEGALKNLDTEITHWDFEKVVLDAKNKWNET